MTHEASSPQGQETKDTAPSAMSHEQMQDALKDGSAQPLSSIVRDYVRLDGSWWLLDRSGWLRLSDARVTSTLDRYEQRLRHGLYG